MEKYEYIYTHTHTHTELNHFAVQKKLTQPEWKNMNIHTHTHTHTHRTESLCCTEEINTTL